MKDLEEAQKAIEMGTSLETVLRQKIDELEDEGKELMVYHAFVALLFIVWLLDNKTNFPLIPQYCCCIFIRLM